MIPLDFIQLLFAVFTAMLGLLPPPYNNIKVEPGNARLLCPQGVQQNPDGSPDIAGCIDTI